MKLKEKNLYLVAGFDDAYIFKQVTIFFNCSLNQNSLKIENIVKNLREDTDNVFLFKFPFR